ncbi:uncharacterized protein LOC129232340 [Uloborus diversus]|uniref:uncharacterized protein LOC129232340 n=1 Tax=Uloborus diversus TaxID=327109 RepID=UPI002408FA25|nr:uncharacterized protein LOC129232340 [Uloborus diversus]
MVNVRVFRFGALLAEANTTFQVDEYISGKLSFNGTIPDSNERHFAATNQSVQISLQLHLPQRIMSSAEFTYSWNIEDVRRSTSMPQTVHRFQNTGRQWIRAAVVARLPPIKMEDVPADASYSYKWGYFEGEIYIKDPFDYINITGNTYLQRGQLLNLDIECNGTGPVDYCWKVLPPGKNQSLSCTDPVTIPECRFPILYYFRDTGEFLLAVHVDNVVSHLQKHIRIQIYDVSLRPQLSTVIVPVVCTVLVLFIIATAVMVHLRRQPPDIETADFDFFRTERGNVILETSLEHMLRMIFRLCYGPPPHAQRVHYGSTLRSNSDSQ